jgi:plastocyanin
VVPIAVWSACVRPAVVTVEAGEIVQWQQADAGQYRVVLDTGTELGPIRHVLEVRLNRPGTYHYHSGQSRDVTGTIIVVGTARPGPAFELLPGRLMFSP